MDALVTVAGYEFPEPSSYNATTSTLVNSGRNVEGKMIGSVIREDVSKVEISWKYLTVAQWARILQCFNSKDKFINEVIFFEPSLGDFVKKTMYISDRKANLFRRDPETGAVMGWVNPSLSLIEV